MNVQIPTIKPSTEPIVLHEISRWRLSGNLRMLLYQEAQQQLRSWFDILRYLRTGSHHERRFKQLRNPVSVHPEVSKGEWSPDPWLSDSLLASLYRRGVFPPSLTPTAYASVLLGTVSVSNSCLLLAAYFIFPIDLRVNEPGHVFQPFHDPG